MSNIDDELPSNKEADQYVHGMDWLSGDLEEFELSNYRKYQYELIAKYLGKNILEIGSGDRSFTNQIVKHSAQLDRIVSIEPSITLFEMHEKKYVFPENTSFHMVDLFNMTKDTFGFFDTAIFIHVFIDAFNNYGVGWFEPFSHHRISFNSVYVADPFLSVWPAIALAALLVLKRTNQRRRLWWVFGLALPAIYLLYSLNNKRIIDTELKNSLQKQNISYTRYFSTPAPLQNWLWFVVAGNDSGYNVGYRSLYDKNENIHFTYFQRNDSLLSTVTNKQEVKQLVRFSQDFYTVEKWHDTVVFNDLRFGQIIGWQKPENHFVFHYFLDHPEANAVVVQRGRFAEWDKEVFQNFLRRIRGE